MLNNMWENNFINSTFKTLIEETIGHDPFVSFFGWLGIIEVSFIGIFILFLALFFPRSGKFTRFLNKLSFEYLLFLLAINTFGIVITGAVDSDIYNAVFGGDSLSMFSLGFYKEYFQLLVNIQQSNSLYFEFVFFFSLVAIAVIFYGIADRFFIANSYDIEFTLLVFLIYVGSLILFVSHNLIEFVLALEIISLGSYALAAYERKSRFSAYAGVQYFILGSIPSGMLIFSLSLMYKAWGTLAIEDIDVLLNQVVSAQQSTQLDTIIENISDLAALSKPSETALYLLSDDWFLQNQSATVGQVQGARYTDASIQGLFFEKKTEMVFALILVMFNLLFKITAAPFNFWAPSVYGNAPVASVTFMSIYSKIAVIFGMVKLLVTIFSSFYLIIITLLLGCGVLSILFGMAGAFAEKTIKRFYVYSSMGHVGFILVAMALSTTDGYTAVFHYLFVYFISSYLMWFILMLMGRARNNLVHFGVLKYLDKWTATIFALLVFSMSGIPPLGGFFVKLDVLLALLNDSKFYVNYLLLFFSVISFFYYLRLIKIIFFDEKKDYVRDVHISEERLWLVAVLFLVLLFYMFLVHKPLLVLENEIIKSIWLNSTSSTL